MQAKVDPSERGCARAEEAAAWVAGELTPPQRAGYEAHCRDCAECRALRADFAPVVESLMALRRAEPSRDLVAGVLAQIPAEAWQSRADKLPPLRLPWRRVALRIAAGLLVAFAMALLVLRVWKQPAPAAVCSRTDAVRQALRWLVDSQEPAGNWDAARWDGKPQYEIALSGMALAALCAPVGGPPDAKQAQAAQRAVAYLLSRQSPQGRFGDEFDGMMYNHGIATVALLSAYRDTRDPGLRAALDRALGFIREQQLPTGGWEYRKGASGQANTAVSVWQTLAIARARECGWTDMTAAFGRALRWLESMVDDRGNFGYQSRGVSPDGFDTLTAMGAFCLLAADTKARQLRQDRTLRLRIEQSLAKANAGRAEDVDYYRWFFVASALQAGGTQSHAQALIGLQKTLLDRRVASGSHLGTWDPAGRWSSVGGRVYTTVMATLSLLPETGR
jgi:hypothetical protein